MAGRYRRRGLSGTRTRACAGLPDAGRPMAGRDVGCVSEGGGGEVDPEYRVERSGDSGTVDGRWVVVGRFEFVSAVPRADGLMALLRLTALVCRMPHDSWLWVKLSVGCQGG